MVKGSVTPKPTAADALSYVESVKEALHDEPAKYQEFRKIMKDYNRGRLDAASVITRVEILLEDHPNLLRGFSVFLPTGATIIIPPTKEDLDSYLTDVKAAFHDNPLKYYVFYENFRSIRRNRVLTGIAGDVKYLEELLQDHQNLFLRLTTFLPAETQRFLHQRAISEDNRKKHAVIFHNMIKERFQGDDLHVFESFLEILKMFKEGNKSVDEYYEEVIELVQGHQDLVMEFLEIFKTHPSG
ncbi:PREDICTED: paired amphipathic helix protein Sin3-like 1 [Camelina sativa]|uniref:Paired amphipathic helix protein Sin3-like 1 n=1 Tax=Camelina sativa TaxID=90675 RepID=A0ABM0X4R2_CAMSA|nr:PREDICTED: paired amphipathic helix protein Sin3-like 1 [Camelina sativa]